MSKNNKGFMLAETIITSVIIITSMILLYTSFNELYISYNTKNKYHNIDAIYATKTTINYLLDNDFNEFINSIFESNDYKIIMDSSNCSEKIGSSTTCNELKDFYKVNKMIIADYDATVLKKSLKESDELELNQTFKEYLDYVVSYYGVSNDDTRYNYIVLTEIKDNNDNYYYANLGIE